MSKEISPFDIGYVRLTTCIVEGLNVSGNEPKVHVPPLLLIPYVLSSACNNKRASLSSLSASSIEGAGEDEFSNKGLKIFSAATDSWFRAVSKSEILF